MTPEPSVPAAVPATASRVAVNKTGKYTSFATTAVLLVGALNEYGFGIRPLTASVLTGVITVVLGVAYAFLQAKGLWPFDMPARAGEDV